MRLPPHIVAIQLVSFIPVGKTLLLSLAVADRLSLREEGQQMDAVALDDTQRRRPTT